MKFCGKIGYLITEETKPSIWTEVIKEQTYFGDITNNNSRWQPSSYVNDDISLDLRISIMADAFALDNYMHMRYVEYMGSKWKITGIVPNYPRIDLTIGGVYNV